MCVIVDRKRSDSEAESAELQQEQDITRRSIKPLTSSTESIHSSTTEHTESTTNKNKLENYKLLNLLNPSEHNRFKQKTKKNSQNKSSQNDTTEDEFYKQNTFPPIRHHKNLQHMRQSRSRKTSGKTKREKVGRQYYSTVHVLTFNKSLFYFKLY